VVAAFPKGSGSAAIGAAAIGARAAVSSASSSSTGITAKRPAIGLPAPPPAPPGLRSGVDADSTNCRSHCVAHTPLLCNQFHT
jgi:hypothetical protein